MTTVFRPSFPGVRAKPHNATDLAGPCGSARLSQQAVIVENSASKCCQCSHKAKRTFAMAIPPKSNDNTLVDPAEYASKLEALMLANTALKSSGLKPISHIGSGSVVRSPILMETVGTSSKTSTGSVRSIRMCYFPCPGQRSSCHPRLWLCDRWRLKDA